MSKSKKKPSGAAAPPPVVKQDRSAETRETELVPLASLHPHPRNYRTHPPEQLRHIVESLRQHGFYRNIVVAQDLTILAGHGVSEASALAGLTEVPIFRLPIDPMSPAALKILAGDNELGKFAETDDRALTELLREIKDTDLDGLLGTGFDDVMLASLSAMTTPTGDAPPGGGGERPPAEAPEDFQDVGGEGAVKTDHTCPRCSYQWSGAQK